MFSKATSRFVRQIEADRNGDRTLIPVSRLNDSHKLVPTAVVVKRNRLWFWQRPVYQPSDFTFSDLLLGDAISPDVTEDDFLSCQGTFGDSLTGTLNAKATSLISLDLEGAGSSKLNLSFGKLKIQMVTVNKLQKECEGGRLVDMDHVLVQQLQKQNEVLAVLKVRIVTTTPCTITETQKKRGACRGLLSFLGKLGKTMEISVMESSSLEENSDVSLEIPAPTVIAYSLIELRIKKDGHFKLCVQPGTSGTCEVDSATPLSHDAFDNLCVVNSELPKLEKYLCLLAELPVQTQRDLFKMLVETLEDRNTLTLLEHTLEECCRAEAQLPVCTSDPARALLDLLWPVHQTGNGSESAECGGPLLVAVHILVSAMEELPDETLSLLTQCSPEILQAIDELICQLRGSCHPLPANSIPAILLDEDENNWKFLERLLHSSSVSLTREAGELRAETGSEAGPLPLVLCLTLRGLSSLCK